MRVEIFEILKAKRLTSAFPFSVSEFLLFTPTRIAVVRQSTKLPQYAAPSPILKREDILKKLEVKDILAADKRNFSISNSDVMEMKLVKYSKWWDRISYPTVDAVQKRINWMLDLNVETNEQRYSWKNLSPLQNATLKTKNIETMLKRIFGKKLLIRTRAFYFARDSPNIHKRTRHSVLKR